MSISFQVGATLYKEATDPVTPPVAKPVPWPTVEPAARAQQTAARAQRAAVRSQLQSNRPKPAAGVMSGLGRTLSGLFSNPTPKTKKNAPPPPMPKKAPPMPKIDADPLIGGPQQVGGIMDPQLAKP